MSNTKSRKRRDKRGNTMIEFFFDCSSPWTYLAFHNIQPLAKEFGAEKLLEQIRKTSG